MRLGTVLLLLAGPPALVGCGRDFADETRRFAEPRPDAAAVHPVTVVPPPGLGEVDTPLTDATGVLVGVPCATCHAPGREPERPPAPFHPSIEMAHGDLRCDACHDPADRTALRLADGRKLDFADAQQLCAQCHGPQHRDWRRGSHGGMAGYWDLTRGPRTRNHCLSCHAAHAPAYPSFQPVHPPRDRYFHPETH